MALGSFDLSAPGVEARPKMGKFRGNRPYGVALLRLREASLSLSNRHPDSGYIGMKLEKKTPFALELLIWGLISIGVIWIIGVLAAFLILLAAVFFT